VPAARGQISRKTRHQAASEDWGHSPCRRQPASTQTRHHKQHHSEEFRAAATLDYQQDQADRGNRRIACPVLFLWSQRGTVAKLYDDPLAIWREWADDVRGGPVPVGHFIPEEAPEETTRRLLDFLP
jgi:pimeloyl-ACP methyl ester carboxylesterase